MTEVSRDDLLEMLRSPRLTDFYDAVRLVAVNQPATWGELRSQMKHPSEWPNLVTYLLGNAITADMKADPVAYLTQILSIAAACYHWHEYLMRVPEFVDAAAEAGSGSIPGVLEKVSDAKQLLADVALQMLTNDAIRAAAGEVVASNWELDELRKAALNRLGSRDNSEDT